MLTVGQSVTDGSVPSSTGTFTYQLTPKTAGAPMPSGSVSGVYTFTVTGTGSADVGITFGTAGIYTYEIRCIAGPGGIYDNRVYTVSVYVESSLATLVVVYAGDGGKAADISFEQSVDTGAGGSGGSSDPGSSGSSGDPSGTNSSAVSGSDPSNAYSGSSNAYDAPGTGDAPINLVVPKTGDYSDLMLWLAMAAVSGCMLLIFLFRCKPRKEE